MDKFSEKIKLGDTKNLKDLKSQIGDLDRQIRHHFESVEEKEWKREKEREVKIPI